MHLARRRLGRCEGARIEGWLLFPAVYEYYEFMLEVSICTGLRSCRVCSHFGNNKCSTFLLSKMYLILVIHPNPSMRQ